MALGTTPLQQHRPLILLQYDVVSADTGTATVTIKYWVSVRTGTAKLNA